MIVSARWTLSGFEPPHVGLLGGREAFGRWTTEARQGQPYDVGPTEARVDRVPDVRGVGNAVDENGGHAPGILGMPVPRVKQEVWSVWRER